MDAREKAKARNKVFMQVIDRLNKSQSFSTHIFDCGDLGFLEICYRGTWRDNWIEIRNLQEFLRDNKPEAGTWDDPPKEAGKKEGKS